MHQRGKEWGELASYMKPRVQMEFSYPEKEAGGKKNQTELLSCSILKATLDDGRKCLKARAYIKLPADLVTRSTITNITVEQGPSQCQFKMWFLPGTVQGPDRRQPQNY